MRVGEEGLILVWLMGGRKTSVGKRELKKPFTYTFVDSTSEKLRLSK